MSDNSNALLKIGMATFQNEYQDMSLQQQWEFCKEMKNLFAKAERQVYSMAEEQKLVRKRKVKETWVEGHFRKTYKYYWKG